MTFAGEKFRRLELCIILYALAVDGVKDGAGDVERGAIRLIFEASARSTFLETALLSISSSEA